MTALARRTLVAGASLALAATAAATPAARADDPLNSPDAELIAACAEFLALHTEYMTRLCPIIRSDDDIAGDAAYDFCDAHPVLALAPATDSAGRAGAWVDTIYAHKLWIVVDIAQGAGTGVPITFQQAQNVAGAGAKSLTGNLNIWANQAEATSDALVQQPAAQSFTTSTATGNKKVVFEAILESIFDITNGFRAIRVSTGASASGNVSAANYFVVPGRFSQQTPPSALV